MYTYFIADDETKIRQGLRQLIDWEELGFYCVGEAPTERKPFLQFWKKSRMSPFWISACPA